MAPRPLGRAGLILIVAALVIGSGIGVFVFGYLSGPNPLSGSACSSRQQSDIPTATPIKHLFVIVKENHAFENYFGSLPGVIGYPPNGSFPTAFNGTQTVSPFPLRGYSTPDLPHDRKSNLVDLNNGRNNLFVAQAATFDAANASDAVGYYTAAQLPDYISYVQHYALGDEFFSGVLGPTDPNRLFDLTANALNWTTDGTPPDSVRGLPSILSQLSTARIPWAYDYSGGTASDVAASWLNSTLDDACAVDSVQPSSALSGQLSNAETAPSIVYLDPSNDPLYSEHPPENISLGQAWTVAAVNAILTSPVAASSAILLFYDENGGFWDPVAPPSRSSTGDGFRVPFLVISPWTPPSRICHPSIDPASVIHWADANWGLPPLNPTVASAGNLSCFFDYSLTPRPLLFLPSSVPLGAFAGPASRPFGGFTMTRPLWATERAMPIVHAVSGARSSWGAPRGEGLFGISVGASGIIERPDTMVRGGRIARPPDPRPILIVPFPRRLQRVTLSSVPANVQHAHHYVVDRLDT